MLSLTVMLSCLAFGASVAASSLPGPMLRRDAPDPADLYAPNSLLVPVDHFHSDPRYEPHSDAYYNLTYYFNADNYVEGGPVIFLHAGEDPGSLRLPNIQRGLVAQLVNATGGIGVVLEHRYYGTSFPTEDLSTENLRFLTIEQALADTAYFAKNVKFPGVDKDLTAPGTAWIAYGPSYPGALVAFLRVTYPEVFWGSIASSAVTVAEYDYWQYYEPVREYGPQDCIDTQTKLINVMDNILRSGDNATIQAFKTAFNATSFTYNDDLASALSTPIGYFQDLNWDPRVPLSNAFYDYCDTITNDTVVFDDVAASSETVAQLIEAGGWANETTVLTNRMLNWIGYSVENLFDTCETTLDLCWGYRDPNHPMYTDKSLDNWGNLSYNYQSCTEYGLFQPGSTVPEDRLPLISRLITLEYQSLPCKYAFNITTKPDTNRVDKYGGYDINYSRLAQVGGEWDPWRPVTPLATLTDRTDRLNGTSTLSEPVILIEKGIHHWEANGRFPNDTMPNVPPTPVRDAQLELAETAKEWMKQWREYCEAAPGVRKSI